MADQQPVIDGAKDQVTQEPTQTQGSITELAAIENIIKRKLTQMDDLKEEVSTYKEMVESYLLNDSEYTGLEEAAKEAAKKKGQKKKELMALQEIRSTGDKLKEAQTNMKEMRQSLSVDLAQFQRLSGTTQIELEVGDLRQIVFIAKLVKRSQQD